MKKTILSLILIFAVTTVFCQVQRYEGSVEYRVRRGNGKIYLTPGNKSDIVFNDSLTMRYLSGRLSFLGGSTEMVGVTNSVMELNGIYITGAESVGQFYRSADTSVTITEADTYYLIEILDQGLSNNLTINDTSAVFEYPGYYEVSLYANLTSNADSTMINIGLFIDDEEQEEVPIKAQVRAAAKFETITGSGIIYVGEGDRLKFYWKADKSGVFTIAGMNINLKRL